jgi:ribosomal protein S27AE
MPTKTCHGCKGQFEARSKRARYCDGECFRRYERENSRRHWATFSPERKRASNMVATAILNKRLIRQPCEVCGLGDAQAHHDDYARPLDVRWLCGGCHKRHHVKHGPGKNAYAAT